MNLRFLSVSLFYFPLSIFFFIFLCYLWDNYRTLLITVLFVRTDRLSCINIRFIIIIFDKRSYFTLCSVSFVRFRRIHYITPHFNKGQFVCACVNMVCRISCELFTFTTSIAGFFLELNDVYWELRSTNVFFKVSRYFYGESEFIVASLSPISGQSFLS